jgi:tetratricopeptide (TPR) repeat protein
MNVSNKRDYYGTSTMTICHPVNSLYLKIGTIFVWGCVNLFPSAAFPAPRIPTDPNEVLERLPMRPGDNTARELASLRAAVTRAAKEAPSDPLPAAQLAERYFDLAIARGDPRYVGYADAVMLPFAQSQSPAALSMRGQLKQYRHDFDGALTDFASALKADPQFASAHAWRGAIFLVQANYAAAKAECDALQALKRATLYGACIGLTRAYGGDLAGGFSALQRALDEAKDTGNRLWLLTRLGEVSAWRGQPEQAEKFYRDALALEIDDGYLLAAWSDFLLDQKRPAEVVKWLANWEASDGLLLRLAIAETALKLPSAKTHVQALADRFAAARMRGDTTHRAEEARFELQLASNAGASLVVAAANYKVQREPRDARALLEAAIAAKDAAAAQPVRDWLQSSGFEDAYLRQLGITSAQLPAIAKAESKQ